MFLADIGFGSLVSAEKILAVLSPESSPVKRTVSEARESGRLVDATYGRKTAAVLIMESDHVILSALTPEELSERLKKE